MDTQQILDRFAICDRLPVEALRAATQNRGAALPVFMAEIERYLAADPAKRTIRLANQVFFIFHILGYWREKSAYRQLAAMLHARSNDIHELLGDCTTETSHRVMAAVFDGDPRPLEEIIFDAEADEYVRARMIEALAMVTLRGGLPREYACKFLARCWDELQPQCDCFVWHGWQAAIAMLGLQVLKPLVLRAYARGSIDSAWLSAADFEEDFQHALWHGGKLAVQSHDEFELFGDPAIEMAHYDCFQSAQTRRPSSQQEYGLENLPYDSFIHGPAGNDYRGVGRNDPCPCGSGKKFKKCCLNALALME
jgi:hypothetical protein